MSNFNLNSSHKSNKSDIKPYIFDKKKQREFIENYINSAGIVAHACKRTRIHRDTYYRYKKDDKEFAKKIEEANNTMCDEVEFLMIEYDIKDPKKFAARKFWLEKHSEKYKPEKEVEHNPYPNKNYEDLTIEQLKEKIEKEIARCEILKATIAKEKQGNKVE